MPGLYTHNPRVSHEFTDCASEGPAMCLLGRKKLQHFTAKEIGQFQIQVAVRMIFIL